MDKQNIVMNEQRWEELVNKVKYSLSYIKDCGGDATEDEINIIVSVLKSNIPFDDCESFDLIDTKVKF